ncbi:MAG: lysylphosphatidylglycerol synthase transmembrane domain-containing protein [Pseudomonadota bacterium]
MKYYLIPMLLLTSLFWYGCYTLAWQMVLNALNKSKPFFELFRIKLAGEASNTLHNTNFISGDILRAHLLNKKGTHDEYPLSVVIDRTIHSLAVLTLIEIAIIVSCTNLDSQGANIRYGIPVATVVILMFVAFISIHLKQGVCGLFLKLCRRVGLGKSFSDRMVERFESLDSRIYDYYKNNRSDFVISYLFHLTGRFFGILEIFIIGRIFDAQFPFFLAFALAALAPLVHATFTFIPGALGVLEAVYCLTCWAFGINPFIGLGIQFFRRGRSLIWIFIGSMLLKTKDRKAIYDASFSAEI